MGSYLTTCFVSQQTISEGDDAYIFPIAQATSFQPVEFIDLQGETRKQYSFTSSTCYPSAFWRCVGPMLTGKYYDYGQFTLDDTANNHKHLYLLFNYLYKESAKTLLGENECHDIAFDIKEIYDPKKDYDFEEMTAIWEKVWDASAYEARLFVCKHGRAYSPFNFAVMHKFAGDYLISNVAGRKDWGGNSLEQTTYFKRYLKKSFLSYGGSDLDTLESLEKELGYDPLMMAVSNISMLSDFGLGSYEGGSLNMLYYSRDDYNFIRNIFKEVLAKGKLRDNLDELVGRIKPMFQTNIDHHYIVSGLEGLNAKFMPTYYAGQDYQNRIGDNVLKMITHVNEEIKKKNKERYEDDDYDSDEDFDEND